MQDPDLNITCKDCRACADRARLCLRMMSSHDFDLDTNKVLHAQLPLRTRARPRTFGRILYVQR